MLFFFDYILHKFANEKKKKEKEQNYTNLTKWTVSTWYFTEMKESRRTIKNRIKKKPEYVSAFGILKCSTQRVNDATDQYIKKTYWKNLVSTGLVMTNYTIS